MVPSQVLWVIPVTRHIPVPVKHHTTAWESSFPCLLNRGYWLVPKRTGIGKYLGSKPPCSHSFPFWSVRCSRKFCSFTLNVSVTSSVHFCVHPGSASCNVTKDHLNDSKTRRWEQDILKKKKKFDSCNFEFFHLIHENLLQTPQAAPPAGSPGACLLDNDFYADSKRPTSIFQVDELYSFAFCNSRSNSKWSAVDLKDQHSVLMCIFLHRAMSLSSILKRNYSLSLQDRLWQVFNLSSLPC